MGPERNRAPRQRVYATKSPAGRRQRGEQGRDREGRERDGEAGVPGDDGPEQRRHSRHRGGAEPWAGGKSCCSKTATGCGGGRLR
jgi:hypothetical protein